MNPFTQKLMQLATGILFALPLGGCASLSAEPLEGQVLEEGTNKPTPEAIVVARWRETRSLLVDAQTVCVHVETATTGENGRYTMPRFKGNPPSLYDSYKPGYERSNEYFRTKAYLQHNDILKPFKGTGEERLKYLKRVEESTRCNVESEQQKIRYPLVKALYEEARNIAVTKQDKRVVNSLLYMVESMELGEEKAFQNMSERRKAENE